MSIIRLRIFAQFQAVLDFLITTWVYDDNSDNKLINFMYFIYYFK